MFCIQLQGRLSTLYSAMDLLGIHRPEAKMPCSSTDETAVLCATQAKEDSFVSWKSRKQHSMLGNQEKNPSATQVT